MSFLRRIWRAITRPTGFVGRDLEGNSFYERPGQNFGARTRRVVKYRKPEDQWHYIGGGRRLPIQWSAWLAHTRANPPTLQELQVDLMRQQRVHHNAQMIQAADEAERREQQRLLQEGLETQKAIPEPQTRPTNVVQEQVQQREHTQPTTPVTEKPAPKLLPHTGSDDFKPESWSPKVSVQRGR